MTQQQQQPEAAAPVQQQQPTVIPGADSLIGDLLDMDLGPPVVQQQQQFPTQQQPQMAAPAGGAAVDLFGEGLDTLVSFSTWKITNLYYNTLRLIVLPSIAGLWLKSQGSGSIHYESHTHRVK